MYPQDEPSWHNDIFVAPMKTTELGKKKNRRAQQVSGQYPPLSYPPENKGTSHEERKPFIQDIEFRRHPNEENPSFPPSLPTDPQEIQEELLKRYKAFFKPRPLYQSLDGQDFHPSIFLKRLDLEGIDLYVSFEKKLNEVAFFSKDASKSIQQIRQFWDDIRAKLVGLEDDEGLEDNTNTTHWWTTLKQTIKQESQQKAEKSSFANSILRHSIAESKAKIAYRRSILRPSIPESKARIAYKQRQQIRDYFMKKSEKQTPEKFAKSMKLRNGNLDPPKRQVPPTPSNTSPNSQAVESQSQTPTPTSNFLKLPKWIRSAQKAN